MLDSEPDNNGFINEDFIVWMRTAALPTFRKLYRLIERKDNLQPTLQAGKYSLDITYSILWKQLRALAGLTTHILVQVQIELAFCLPSLKNDDSELCLKTSTENWVEYYHFLLLCKFL